VTRRGSWFGLAFIAAGLAIVAAGLGGAADEGVPVFVPVVAGAAFVLAGLIVVVHEGRRGDTLLARTLTALLVTGLTVVCVVIPPSLLAMGPITALAWIAVARLVIEKRTGRDPLASWSEARVLGLGCGCSVLAGLLLVGAAYAASCAQHPRERPPAEAPL
jgi:hypothetical protein